MTDTLHHTPAIYTPVVALPDGKEPLAFNNTPLNDTGTMGLVMLSFFFIAITFRGGYKYIADFAHHSFSVRRRQNAFEDHTTSETLLMMALITNTCLMEGILLYLGINEYLPALNLSQHVFSAVGYLTLLCIGFFLLQLTLYATLGYVFARDREDTGLWLDGFKSTQSVLGLFLSPIVFIILLYPRFTVPMLYIAGILYFCARLVFVSKGFRIFFNNFSSYVYFILYLCTVEIVPVFLMLAGAIRLSETL